MVPQLLGGSVAIQLICDISLTKDDGRRTSHGPLGNRDFNDETFWREYQPSEIARRYGASGDSEQPPPETWKVERPARWGELPWS